MEHRFTIGLLASIYNISAVLGIGIGVIAVFKTLSLYGTYTGLIIIGVMPIFSISCTIQSIKGKKWPVTVMWIAISLPFFHLTELNQTNFWIFIVNLFFVIVALVLSIYFMRNYEQNKPNTGSV